jgi:hypothetical protein
MNERPNAFEQAGRLRYPQKHVPDSPLIIRISVHFAQFVISLQRLSKTDNGRD